MARHDPIAEFRELFDKAKRTEAGDATACCLATADADGRPAARMVLLKGVEGRDFLFFTNYTSRKAHRQEVLHVDGSVIRIEKGFVEVDERHEFDLHWARLRVETQPGWRKSVSLFFGSHGNFVEIGSFLNGHEKESLAFELNQSILTNGFLRVRNE